MAKKNEKAVAQPTELSVDTVENVIKSSNTANDDVARKAAEKLAAGEEERQVQSTMRAIQRAEFTNLSHYLYLKKTRFDEHTAKKYADESLKLRDELTNGKITFNEFDKKLNDMLSERRKDFAENRKKYEELKRELRTKFQNASTYDLEWELDDDGRRYW